MYIFGVGDCHRLSPGVTVVLITYRGFVSAVSDDMCGRFCPMRKSEYINICQRVVYVQDTYPKGEEDLWEGYKSRVIWIAEQHIWFIDKICLLRIMCHRTRSHWTWFVC